MGVRVGGLTRGWAHAWASNRGGLIENDDFYFRFGHYFHNNDIIFYFVYLKGI